MVLADRVSERAVADRQFGNSLLVRQINMQASLCSGKYECIIHKQKVEATKDASSFRDASSFSQRRRELTSNVHAAP